MKATSPLLLLLLALLFVLPSCLEDDIEVDRYHYTDAEYNVISKNLNLPRDLINYEVKFASHLEQRGVATPHIKDEKATLGRVLFYDDKLSKNRKVSCASCHKQELAFSDDVALSEGFQGELTVRNSLPLGAVANFESSYDGGSFFNSVLFFWDERASTIEEQCVETIQNEIEMGMQMWELVDRLEQEEYYRILFRKAYGDEFIDADRITEALAEFINSIVSTNSKFDEGMNHNHSSHNHFSNFSEAENVGKMLFVNNCASCHSHDMSTAVESVANNGLDLEYTDRGVGSITYSTFDNGKFKVPFLRNIALTAPYMHDGRFATLEEVVDHYSTGIKDHPNLDFRLRNHLSSTNEPIKFNFTQQEKDALVAFLNTLTDYEFLEAEKYADPFR